jgi:hypothetical protein
MMKPILFRDSARRMPARVFKEMFFMRDDYKLVGPTQKIEIEVEKEIAEKLAAMEKQSKLTRSELTNTALKRFISAHKDFLPTDLTRGN